MPGMEFRATRGIPSAQESVFGFTWLKRGAPSPEHFEEAKTVAAGGQVQTRIEGGD